MALSDILDASSFGAERPNHNVSEEDLYREENGTSGFK
jgi:hypothetical protein